MKNFDYRNPVYVCFGKGKISQLSKLINPKSKVLMTYGSGSIFKNGVYEQVKSALKNYSIIEFGGIEANPQHETLLKAARLAKKENVDFILAVGGGSVIDGSKFIAASIPFLQEDPWKRWQEYAPITNTLPLGVVLTLSATGSEMNGFSVISDSSTKHKFANGDDSLLPQFAILDPSTTFSLSQRQLQNGIVDPFVHITEQYLTYPVNSPVQDRQAEALLSTLVEEGPKVFSDPSSYDVRANLMWSATMALNGLIGCGVPQDWSVHAIGHELTTHHGIDHGQSLAIILPGLLRHQLKNKIIKLSQCGKRVFNLEADSPELLANKTIDSIEKFFQSLGVKTKLSDYGFGREKFQAIAEGATLGGRKLGENQNLGAKEILEILEDVF